MITRIMLFDFHNHLVMFKSLHEKGFVLNIVMLASTPGTVEILT